MTYNTVLDNLLINLKILSKVSENGKISTIGSNITLETDKILTPFFRYIHGDSRQKAIDSIHDLINSTIQISNSILQHSGMTIYDRKTHPTSFEKNEFNKLFEQLKTISSEMQNSLTGIENLKITYQDDACIVAQLEVIHDNIRRQILEIENNLEHRTNNKSDKNNNFNLMENV